MFNFFRKKITEHDKTIMLDALKYEYECLSDKLKPYNSLYNRTIETLTLCKIKSFTCSTITISINADNSLTINDNFEHT